MDKWEKLLEAKVVELEQCQVKRELSSCSLCVEFLKCTLRLDYVKAVYQSMSKGKDGGFEF